MYLEILLNPFVSSLLCLAVCPLYQSRWPLSESLLVLELQTIHMCRPHISDLRICFWVANFQWKPTFIHDNRFLSNVEHIYHVPHCKNSSFNRNVLRRVSDSIILNWITIFVCSLSWLMFQRKRVPLVLLSILLPNDLKIYSIKVFQ